MKPFLSRVSWVRFVILTGVLFFGGWCLRANSLTDSWTNSVSGYWEDPYWSLGALPGAGQTVLFTNAGWKALAIGANTAQNFPQTLTVDSITVSSPTNSFNTLLLNYAGLQTPLTANALTVGSNSAVVMYSSSLHVSNNISIGGAFTQDVSSEVANGNLSVGNVGPAVYNLIGGTLKSSSGEDVGFSFPSTFVQQGGTNDSYVLGVHAGSEYDLDEGELIAGDRVIRGTLKQQGGRMNAYNEGLFRITGNFSQSGGICNAFEMDMPDVVANNVFGSVLQTGGTNQTSFVNLGYQYPGESDGSGLFGSGGAYTLSGGALITTASRIAAYGTMEQSGGSHLVGGLNIGGAIFYYYGRDGILIVNAVGPATYLLEAGMLSAQGIGIAPAGTLAQSGGTNQVAGDIALTGAGNPVGYGLSGQYQLTGGWLTASNLIVSFPATFSQSGGQLLVSNIQLIGGSFSQSGGAVTQSGVLTLAGASWSAAGEQHFGQLQLSGSSNSASVLNLPVAACALRLAGSSGLIWSNAAVLKIENWRGSPSGGGQHQIIFGTDAAALTAQQLSQIQFHNPGGSRGTFPAMILSNGEIVPSQWLSSQPNGIALVLQWGNGFILQSATNIGGPYQNVSGAASPYTNQFSEPQRFFRLRK